MFDSNMSQKLYHYEHVQVKTPLLLSSNTLSDGLIHALKSNSVFDILLCFLFLFFL